MVQLLLNITNYFVNGFDKHDGACYLFPPLLVGTQVDYPHEEALLENPKNDL